MTKVTCLHNHKFYEVTLYNEIPNHLYMGVIEDGNSGHIEMEAPREVLKLLDRPVRFLNRQLEELNECAERMHRYVEAKNKLRETMVQIDDMYVVGNLIVQFFDESVPCVFQRGPV